MELKILTFILGSLLLLIGIFGGGFQVKELKIPQIGKFSRFLATSLGIFFIVLSLGLDTPPDPGTGTNDSSGQSGSSGVRILRDWLVSFDLTNQTSRNIERFFASPANVNSWGQDILGTEVLPPGQKAKITIQDGRKDCMYDFRARLGAAPNGSVGPGDMIQFPINICTDFYEWGFVEK